MARAAARLRPGEAPAPRRVAPFSPEMWAGLNTGRLERALDAQARPGWSWPRIGLGLAVGLLFAVVNQYVGLRTGLIVFGSWYVVFLAGLALRWGPRDINLAAIAGSGANFIVGGYAYVLPALWLVAASGLLAPPSPLVLGVAVAATVLCGVLGALAFGALRRAWLVEQPLPYPSFEQYLQLLALAEPKAPVDRRRAARLLGVGGVAAGAWTFLRDWPSGALRPLEATGWYGSAGLQQPLDTAQFTWLNLSLSPLLVAVGWFMRLRIALVIAGGAAFAWLVAVPFAVALGVPAPAASAPALAAWQGPVRALAAGTLVGAGLAALLRFSPLLAPAVRDSLRLRRRPGGGHEVPGHYTGWAALACLVGLPLLLMAAGAPPLAAALVAVVAVAGIFVLGAIAVKVAGETSLEPASASGVLVVLLLVGLLAALGLPPGQVALLALLGGAAFFAGITMMGNLLLDMKLALYVGNAPRPVMAAALLGIVPGALVGALALAALAPALAAGSLQFPAPQAQVFATLVQTGLAATFPLELVGLGLVVGAFAEARTRLGTAFGLGMFLPLGIPAAFLLGAGLREGWERRAAALPGPERDGRRLDTYLLATGLMVGEALVGTAAALLLALGG